MATSTPRSLKLSSDGKRQVERALTDKAWSTEDLAAAVDVGRATATTFRAGKKGVDRQNFVKFCQALGLDWAAVAEMDGSPTPKSGGVEPIKTASATAENLQQNSNDSQGVQVQGSDTTIVGQTVNVYHGSVPQDLVTKPVLEPTELDEQRIRQHCRETILHNYSKIRLLSGKNIGVDQLYVDVWLLDRSPRTFQRSHDKMLETFDLRNDRLGLGDRIKRDTGIKFANAESKLLILGKPGTGKTTFLKHLAVDWCKGKFQPQLIAVFIEFRQIRDGQWKLLNETISKSSNNFYEDDKQELWLKTIITEKLNMHDEEKITALLQAGKLMILMDGFDEVPTGEIRRKVQNQLKEIAQKYSKNRYILTCRTQVITSIPDGFTSVEVADFNEQQVAAFVQNWFRANGQNEIIVRTKWETFRAAISRNAALRELTVTPVLLGLMCLVLQDEGEIPVQASLLYERGIKLLLRKWNDAKAIDGWEVGTEIYRKLDVEQKEDLLIQIAVNKFESPQNFVLFEEEDLIQHIVETLNLQSRADGKAALKAIEAQHGLLIERADELWSFSHLTFQEHFTTKWLLRLSPEELTRKITDKHWQDVMQQLVMAQGQSDRLLRLIKQAIDQMPSQDPSLQKFLTWLERKARTIQGKYREATIRAFYFYLDLALDRNCSLALALNRVLDLALGLARGRALARARSRAFSPVLALAPVAVPLTSPSTASLISSTTVRSSSVEHLRTHSIAHAISTSVSLALLLTTSP
jgi:DNA-binding Xre family transcriptional regulator